MGVWDVGSNYAYVAYQMTVEELLSGHWFTMTNDASGNMALYIDGRLASATRIGTTGVLSSKPTTAFVGCAGTTQQASGIAVRRLVFNNSPTSWNVNGPPTTGIGSIGDSITVGTAGGGTEGYPSVMVHSILGPRYATLNMGEGGSGVSFARQRWRQRIRGRGYSVLTMMTGVNDILNSFYDATGEWARQKIIIDEALADGLHVVVMTILPFRTYSGWNSGKEAMRLAVNASILSYNPVSVTRRYHPVDTAAAFDDGTGALRGGYDSGDHLHPNQAGNAYLAALVAAAIA
jgi:lysophospholipase L1-like esterase